MMSHSPGNIQSPSSMPANLTWTSHVLQHVENPQNSVQGPEKGRNVCAAPRLTRRAPIACRRFEILPYYVLDIKQLTKNDFCIDVVASGPNVCTRMQHLPAMVAVEQVLMWLPNGSTASHLKSEISH